MSAGLISLLCCIFICYILIVLQFAESFKIEYHSGVPCCYKLAVYASKSESLVETLAERLLIAEAEFVIDEFFTSKAKLELKLTSQGRVTSGVSYAHVNNYSVYSWV